MTKDARKTTGGTRNSQQGLWAKWWDSLSRSERRAITTSSYPVRVVNGKVVRQAHDH